MPQGLNNSQLHLDTRKNTSSTVPTKLTEKASAPDLKYMIFAGITLLLLTAVYLYSRRQRDANE